MIRVDAHHHVWRPARGDYDWLTAGSPLHRDYGLDDLRPLLGDVEATVLVQAAQTEAETRFMLETALQSRGLVRGVVGWTDLAEPDGSERVAELSGEALLKGLRPMLQDLSDHAWILQPTVRPALAEMAARDLVFDALIRPRQLPAMHELAKRHPRLRIVIDHGAKPNIASGQLRPWAEDIALIAREPNVSCKLSGLVTEASPDWCAAALAPVVEHLLGVFGPHRMMWGSDWPVVDLAGGYGRWRSATAQLLRRLSQPAQDAILGGTAAAVYRL